jgi:hypothetical protein
MLWRYIILWFGLMFLAILNGLIRERFYRHYLGELAAHQASTVSLLFLISVFVWVFTRFWPLESSGQALSVGAIWFTITIVFEFIFGHFIMKKSWATLLRDYNLLQGRIWLLILLWTLLAPFTFYHLQQ